VAILKSQQRMRRRRTRRTTRKKKRAMMTRQLVAQLVRLLLRFPTLQSSRTFSNRLTAFLSLT
jgi:hypothetical protein